MIFAKGAALAVIACVAGYAASSPAAVPFNITYFHASVQAGTTTNDYLFHVQTSDVTNTLCQAREVSDQGKFMNVSRTACADATVAFRLTFKGKDGGAVLELWHASDSSGLTTYGSYGFPASWFDWKNSAVVGLQEVYDGPLNFTVTNVADAPTV